MSLRRRALFALATSSAFERGVRAAPGGRARAWRSARRYVAGEHAGDALAVAAALGDRGLGASIDALLPDVPGAACELLLGVHPADAVAPAAAGRDVRVYVPYGAAWFRYFMRRRAEAQGA